MLKTADHRWVWLQSVDAFRRVGNRTPLTCFFSTLREPRSIWLAWITKRLSPRQRSGSFKLRGCSH
ncbi:hypothetical protein JMJ77_0014363, partial [Colletotrichum scovillei]